MKRLSITLLALALALVMSVPAMAIHIGDDASPEGSIGFTGRYQMDGEARDVDGTKSDFYDDDLDLSITLIKGDVKALIGLEIADTNPWETSGHARNNVIDNYYVEWSAMDNLKVKIGEYGIAFGRNIGTDGAGARNIQVTYSLDALDITGALMVEDDGSNGAIAGTTTSAGDDDNNTLYLKLSAKEAGPFTKLDVVSYTQQNDVTTVSSPTAEENSYTGVDLALPIGPVDVAFEYGANGGDLDGTFMLVEIGLEELVGFDLGVNYFVSSDDYAGAYDGNDWAPGMILGDQVNGDVGDMTAIWLTAGYSVSDNLSLGATLLLSAENDAGDEYGTEVDVSLKYKIADNISYKLAYGTYSEGDNVVDSNGDMDDLDTTELFHRIEFKF